ncbi:MAG TPA: GNAT family N-acetyltransferase, partial [Candidatus Polarisedimenticolia bacterium]|nr:GNAT family N-acetyltransferase [Candidatus Polarisedimenticolia bacterium]
AIRDRDILRILVMLGRRVRLVRFDRALVMGVDVMGDRPMLRRLREREPGMTVRAVGPEAHELLRVTFPFHAARYPARFERGDACLLVESGGAPAAMGWIRFRKAGGIDELGCLLELPEDACWGHDTYVLPPFRARGAFAVLMWELFERLKARGVRVMYASIAWENSESRASHGRLGYTTALVLDRLNAGGIRFYRLTSPGSSGVWRRPGAGRAPQWRLT